jgi:CheY-like chemotaxis protein
MDSADLPVSAILHIDDNVGDQTLTKIAFDECCRAGDQHVGISSASEAIRLLCDRARATVPPPTLIILDINMPAVDGWSVLAFIKRMPTLDKIPVAMLSTSDRQEDAARAESMGAEYHRKPSTFAELRELMRSLYGRRLVNHP